MFMPTFSHALANASTWMIMLRAREQKRGQDSVFPKRACSLTGQDHYAENQTDPELFPYETTRTRAGLVRVAAFEFDVRPRRRKGVPHQVSLLGHDARSRFSPLGQESPGFAQREGD